MKYLVILGDGMADYPVPELGDKTPLQAAFKPNIDYLAARGILGMAKTVPEGMPPGSDTANLSAMGYDPKVYYSGRSPLEAVSMGIKMGAEELSYRCNLVTLSNDEPYEQKTMLDYSAGEITTAEAHELITALKEHLDSELLTLYPGISYRHCLLRRQNEAGTRLVPPHDITNKKISEYLPDGVFGEQLLNLMKCSYEILKNHPVNQKREARGLNPANSAWFWGEGKKPALKPFKAEYGLDGAVISAVDLIKGIALCAAMQSIDVAGATGTIDTNFAGKAEVGIKALLGGKQFLYLHLEAPDECGHHYQIEDKKRAIELIDQLVVGPVVAALRAAGEDFRIMVLPDHPTPLSLRTHTDEPVPFLLYDSTDEKAGGQAFSEQSAQAAGLYLPQGYKLMSLLTKGFC
ncbi:MAG: cofactor-independent phosphoglycerate mutase [Clostridia bacterium]|nr:cofactor-independent phosphoglycerate mutase [Clostridia bacterium]